MAVASLHTLVVVAFLAAGTNALNNGVGRTPPMGYCTRDKHQWHDCVPAAPGLDDASH